MKKYGKIIKYFILILIICFVAFIIICGPPHKKKKGEWKKHKMEMRMKNDTIHTDSARTARMKIWKERKKHKRDSKK
jgi:large-conductance mechanosensitive channel